jgi:hypothetical protein
MKESCKGSQFLSASVSTPRRDRIPQTEVKLTDPASREQGANATGTRISRSQYESVAEVPKFPKLSMQHAVEVCDAGEGEYLLTIYEHGDERYRITVGVYGNENNEFLPENFRSQEGRIRQFKFLFKIKKREVFLTWLDENGRPHLHVANNDW